LNVRSCLAFLAALCALQAAISTAPANAHTRSISYSAWELDSTGATVRTRISRLDVTRLGLYPVTSEEDSVALGRYLVGRLELRADSAICPAQRPPIPLRAPTGWLAFSWRLECPGFNVAGTGEPEAIPRTIHSRVLLEVAPSHLHFIRLESSDGSILDRVTSEAEPFWELPRKTPGPGSAGGDSDSSALASIARYLSIGVEHILSGWDHLAFVIALLLLARTFAQVATLVTSFTAAHSVTLGLATLEIIRPEAAAVEALIGFSIALVAAENAWLIEGKRRAIPVALVAALLAMAMAGGGTITRTALLGLALFSACHFGLLERSTRPERLRAAVAFAFGLIHGFGFAGVLTELSLPTDRLVPALLGFNLGVELGQLAVIAIAWPLLRALGRAKSDGPARLVTEIGSATICGLGLFWFVTRYFG